MDECKALDTGITEEEFEMGVQMLGLTVG